MLNISKIFFEEIIKFVDLEILCFKNFTSKVSDYEKMIIPGYDCFKKLKYLKLYNSNDILGNDENKNKNKNGFTLIITNILLSNLSVNLSNKISILIFENNKYILCNPDFFINPHEVILRTNKKDFDNSDICGMVVYYCIIKNKLYIECSDEKIKITTENYIELFKKYKINIHCNVCMLIEGSSILRYSN